MRFITRLLICMGALAALLAMPALASAALPKAKTQYTHEGHVGQGNDWHVELEVGTDTRRLKSIVLYLQECDVTAFAEDVPVSDTGAFEVVATLPKGGTYRVTGSFVSATHAHGEFELTNEKCSPGTGVRTFDAHPAKAGGAHGGHDSTSSHRGGTPPRQYARLDNKTPAQIAEAARLWSRTLTIANTPAFKTYRAVRRLYKITARRRPRPLIFHVHRAAYDTDRFLFAATRPESLVYWWGSKKGPPRLVAFMYRANTLIPPKFAGGIFGWHAHNPTAMPMTHVWLTGDLRSSAANCMPVPELEAYLPGFKYEKPAQLSGHESLPCPTGDTADDGHTGDDH